MKLKLEGKYSKNDIVAIQQYLMDSNEEISVTNSEFRLGLLELVPLATLTVAIAKFWYDYEQNKKKDKVWTIDRIKEILESKLMELGYLNYKDIIIENPNNLLKSSKLRPCIISVSLEDVTMIKFKLFKTGGIYQIISD